MNEPLQIQVGEYTYRVNSDGKQWLDHDMGAVAYHEKLPANALSTKLIAALAAELARARRDSERLDWLERNVSQVVCHGVVGVAFLHDQDGNPPLRAAIDAAAQPPTGTGEGAC